MARMPVIPDPRGAVGGRAGVPLELPPATLSRVAWTATKRSFDFAASLVGLIVLLPVLLAIAALVKLDSPGPALFRQRRFGHELRPFTLLKFRTMQDGADPKLHQQYIEQLATQPTADDGELKKLTNDPRVTRVGGVLRKLSLDELPQLVNVLLGHMSLVGPRPAIEYELEHYEPRHYERFNVKPGLTGLWQVAGRNELGFNEMLDLDVEYSRTAGPLMDARCLVLTPRALYRKCA